MWVVLKMDLWSKKNIVFLFVFLHMIKLEIPLCDTTSQVSLFFITTFKCRESVAMHAFV